VKFGLKIPNRLGKKCQKISGGGFLTHTVDIEEEEEEERGKN